MKIIAPITIAIALAIPLPALSAMSGDDLLARCSASEKSMNGEKLNAEEMLDSMWCVGYLSGLLDGFGVADFKVDNEKMVCPNEGGLTRSQALTTITRFLRDHPEERAKSGRRNALVALSKAFPCK
jgi:hypothetical protein